MKKSVTVSVVWKHFKARGTDPTKVVCLLCFPQGDDEMDPNVKYLSRGPKIKSFSTKPMWNHLRSMHPFEHECAYNSQQQYLQQQLINQKQQQHEQQQKKLQRSAAGGGSSSGSSARNSQKDSMQYFNALFRNPFLSQPFADSWNPLFRSTNFDIARDERKTDLGIFPGTSEGSVGSAGDNQGTSDDISIPLSPEQYMSEETEPVTSGGGGASCSGPSPHSNPQRPESYKLRHNNHLTLVLESLAGDESFMDVTLTAQGKAIKAHKSVLSAVSPYFRSVLKANPCQHPIIIMPRDIRFEELNNIISYIYKGEMTVAASDLSSLLKTAEVLQVTGLSPSETNSGSCGIMSQVHGFPSTTRVPNIGNSVSHSFSKKHSQKQNQQNIQHQQPQQQPHQQMEQGNDEDDDDEAMNEDTNDSQERGVDPLDFLNANMTCVKEEIRSDDEAEGEGGGGQEIPGSITNLSPTHNERESDCVSSNLQNQFTGGSPKPVEDITSKPFNPGETDEPAIENPSLEDQTGSAPFVCPYCLEVHRPVEMLQSHLRLKHPSKPSFICGCGKVYCRSSTFADHSKKCKF